MFILKLTSMLSFRSNEESSANLTIGINFPLVLVFPRLTADLLQKSTHLRLRWGKVDDHVLQGAGEVRYD